SATSEAHTPSLPDALPSSEAVRTVEVDGQPVRRFGSDPAVVPAAPGDDQAAGGGLPAWAGQAAAPDPLARYASPTALAEAAQGRSEEHTSELQSRENLVCR